MWDGIRIAVENFTYLLISVGCVFIVWILFNKLILAVISQVAGAWTMGKYKANHSMRNKLVTKLKEIQNGEKRDDKKS